MDLQRRIVEREGEFLLFSLVPPRLSATPDEAQRIADVTLERLQPLGLDGLIVYDIDDESDRNPEKRPYPYLPTMDPADFVERNLAKWESPVLIYRSVGKYPAEGFRSWLGAVDADKTLSVFVGASSRDKDVSLSLRQAYDLRSESRPDLVLGAVAIPERHRRRGDEHERLIDKQLNGCSFFVTQVVYDINAAKDVVSDYHYACREQGISPVPIVFTFSVCGSMKTMEFLQWLGVDVPRWVQNDLRHAEDTLDASCEQAAATALDLVRFCRNLRMPFGVNIESVSNRRVEIEASIRLATRLREELAR